MSTIQNTTSTTNSLSGLGTGTSSAQQTQDRFLQLLVTQMKNQDPLNPMDNAQVTSQMAQLSTVTGIDKLNASLQSMAASFTSSQTLQAASMIGRGILAPGSSLVLQNGSAIGGYVLDQPVDNAVVTVKDAAGNTLKTVDMGAQKAGNIKFQWDGTLDGGGAAAPGTYTFEVNALQGGKKVTADALALDKVASVTLGTQGVMLNTATLGAIDITTVKEIF